MNVSAAAGSRGVHGAQGASHKPPVQQPGSDQGDSSDILDSALMMAMAGGGTDPTSLGMNQI